MKRKEEGDCRVLGKSFTGQKIPSLTRYMLLFFFALMRERMNESRDFSGKNDAYSRVLPPFLITFCKPLREDFTQTKGVKSLSRTKKRLPYPLLTVKPYNGEPSKRGIVGDAALGNCPANLSLHRPAVEGSIPRLRFALAGTVGPLGLRIENHRVGKAAHGERPAAL